MGAVRGRADRLLRWYPATWRSRYGEELTALLEDTYGDGRVPVGQRLSLAGRGLHERARRSALIAGDGDPARRARSGSLVVLCSWPAFVIAGGAFAKYAEHWDAATPPSARWLPAAAYDVVVAGAVAGATVVALGALVALPAFVSFLRAGRWRELRAAVAVAVALTALSVTATVGAVLWAHGQSTVQRNTTSVLGLGLGGAFALCLVATLAAWCTAVVAAVGRLELSGRSLQVEGALAVALLGAMAAVTAGTVTWWAALATSAPRVLSDNLLGSWGPGLAPVLVGAGLLMTAGLSAATVGVVRVVRALPSLTP
ncbi:MAG: hypothetical protein KGJ77_02905 [Acidobacteriota bacterium]|nr:hypothetical protein [Acidobacteriota bacterium]